jgi:hypothetical protein
MTLASVSLFNPTLYCCLNITPFWKIIFLLIWQWYNVYPTLLIFTFVRFFFAHSWCTRFTKITTWNYFLTVDNQVIFYRVIWFVLSHFLWVMKILTDHDHRHLGEVKQQQRQGMQQEQPGWYKFDYHFIFLIFLKV